MDDINYKVLELDHLQALSIKQKEQEGEERKKLAELIERLQEDLEDQVIKKKNDHSIEGFFKNIICFLTSFLLY